MKHIFEATSILLLSFTSTAFGYGFVNCGSIANTASAYSCCNNLNWKSGPKWVPNVVVDHGHYPACTAAYLAYYCTDQTPVAISLNSNEDAYPNMDAYCKAKFPGQHPVYFK